MNRGSLRTFIDDKYQSSPMIELIKQNEDIFNIESFRAHEEGSQYDTDFILDGENVIIGDNRLKLLQSKSNKFRYLMETVCKEKIIRYVIPNLLLIYRKSNCFS